MDSIVWSVGKSEVTAAAAGRHGHHHHLLTSQLLLMLIHHASERVHRQLFFAHFLVF